MASLIANTISQLSALPREAYLLNAITWVILNALTLLPALNAATRTARLQFFWAYAAVQAFYLYNMGDVYTFVSIETFPGFLIIKFFMHVSYIVLVEDVCVAGEDGSWSWLRMYNAVTDVRGVEEMKGREKEKERARAREMKRVEQEVQDSIEVATTGNSTAIPDGPTTRSRGAKTKRPSVDSGYSSIADTDSPTSPSPTEFTIPIRDFTADLPPNPPFIQSSDLASLYRTLATSYTTLSPSSKFLLTRLFHLLAMHTLTRSIASFNAHLTAHYIDPSEDLAPHKIHLLSRLWHVTLRELLFRAYIAALYVGYPSIAMAKYHSLLALIHVSVLRWSTPDSWPWLFGPLSQSTSQRAFWSGFWHRLFAAPAVKWARWGAVMLGLRGGAKGELRKDGILGTLVYPLYLTFSIFLLSGLMHMVVESRFSECGWDADLWWGMMNWAGIVLEGVWQFVVERGAVKRFWERHPRVYRACGYVWTGMFFVWCMPKVKFTRTNCYAELELERLQDGLHSV